MSEKPPKIDRVHMPTQQAEERTRNFREVPLGLSAEKAQREASRCLMCKKRPCVDGCPVAVQIPEFIKLIKDGDFIAAARKIKETNVLPAVCGRVCPQEDQCEKQCILAKTQKPVAIGYLERFAADYERINGTSSVDQPSATSQRGRKVAIVGAGPSGITCASELANMGYQVTLFEAFHKAGGVLVYGIPEFRLPKAIVQKEVDYVQTLGVELKLNHVIGRIFSIDELTGREGFSAVYIATGAGFPSFMNIPGENLNFVYSANEFLTRMNLMKAYDFPKVDTPVYVGKRCAVIGGGNTALDAARCAKRLGPDKVYLIYRRSHAEMPARVEEIEHAEEEGIEFMFLHTPIRYEGDADGYVKKAICQRMELGEPDSSGRRRPVPVEGSEFELQIDSVIVGIGTQSNPLISQTTPDLETNKWGYIVTKTASGQTSKQGVFAGGDIVSGAATVILAMGAGREAAKAIDKYLKT